MKITQEVRAFAARQNAPIEQSIPVEDAEAEAGMAAMSERYREGGDLYLRAGQKIRQKLIDKS